MVIQGHAKRNADSSYSEDQRTMQELFQNAGWLHPLPVTLNFALHPSIVSQILSNKQERSTTTVSGVVDLRLWHKLENGYRPVPEPESSSWARVEEANFLLIQQSTSLISGNNYRTGKMSLIVYLTSAGFVSTSLGYHILNKSAGRLPNNG